MNIQKIAIGVVAMLLTSAVSSAANITTIQASTNTGQHWYVLRNANRTNAVLTDEGAGKQVYGRVYSTQPSQMWRFVSIGSGAYRIESRLGHYLSGSGATDEVVYGSYGTTNTSMAPSLTADKSKWSIVPVGQTANAVHFTRTAQLPYYCITWQATSVDSYWTLEEVPDINVPVTAQSDLDNLKAQLQSYQTSAVGDKMGQLTSRDALNNAINDLGSWSSLIGQSYSTFLTKRSALLKTIFNQPRQITAEGTYALRMICSYPDYIYASDGRYLGLNSNSDRTLLRLFDDYSYARCCFNLHTDAEGHTYLTSSSDTTYIYLQATALKHTSLSDNAFTSSRHMAFYADDARLTASARVAWALDTLDVSDADVSLRFAKSNATASTVTVPAAGSTLSRSMVFRLIPMAPHDKLQALSNLIDSINALFGTNGSGNAKMDSTLAWAANELNYIYLSSSDAEQALSTLQKAYDSYQAAKTKTIDATGVSATTASQMSIRVIGHRIYVDGVVPERIYDASGKLMDSKSSLQPGIYLVKQKGQTFKARVK
jgi:hypothetical protein